MSLYNKYKKPAITLKICISLILGSKTSYIYCPFEVDEIIVDNGNIDQQDAYYVKMLTVSSNLFSSTGGTDIALLSHLVNVPETLYTAKKTKFSFNNSIPINGSYIFNIDSVYGQLDSSEVKLYLTFNKY